jgi:polysaccharide export outer membrane protein
MGLGRLKPFCNASLCALFILGSFLVAQNSAPRIDKNPTITVSPAANQVEDTTPAHHLPAENYKAKTDLRIGSGDLLEIKVYGSPELSNTVRVSDAGEMTMPLIGAVEVSGLTAEEAQKRVEQRLVGGGFLRDPQVNILVKEFATQGISILGEVVKPGVYPLLGSRRLFDAVSIAGGTTIRAGNTVVITHRDQPSTPEVVTLARDPKEAARQNIKLIPGDTVMVVKSGIVYVSGDVRTPGGYAIESNESLTVLQAIALAQGLNPTASTKNVRIIRKNSGVLQEIPVELKEIMQAKAPDVALQNDDVLFIPSSASKSAARRSLESIVQVATGLAIYRR